MHLPFWNRGRLALVIALVLVALGTALAFAAMPGSVVVRYEEQAAESMVSHVPSEAWPPVGGNLDLALSASAIRAISESAAYDAGVTDAGPPIALPDAPIEGLLVRQGELEGFHYLEVVLGGATSFDDALPLVVVLHGRGGAAQLPGGPFLGLTHPVRVVVPQAPDRLGEGWEWLPVSVGSGMVDRLASSLFATSSKIATLVRELVVSRPTVGRPIVTGFSQGGLLTWALALHHDDVVAHAFPLSTWLPPPLEPLYKRSDLRFPPIRAMHGAIDPIIPVAPTRTLVTRLATLGFDVELRAFEGVGHAMSAEMDALFHRWLDRAVCIEVGDGDCVAQIEEALATQPTAPIEPVAPTEPVAPSELVAPVVPVAPTEP